MIWPRRAAQGTATPQLVGPAAPRPILVGVDGSAASARALEWATVRAFAGHTALHILYVLRTRVWLDPSGLSAVWDVEPPEVAQQVLDEAVRSALRVAPGLQISTRLRRFDRAEALVDEGRSAELIVLGRGDEPRRTEWLHLSRRVARRARGRVVIVSADDEVLV